MEELRRKLEETIEEYGVGSRQAYEVSIQLDEEIVKYYQNEKMALCYQKGKLIYDNYVRQKDKITNIEWNEIAKNERLLSSETMKYIGDLEFERIEE